tara:strand:- start:86 stop:1651 length:1566 start_codon:yes stop_codon:yes gene_type:complete
MPTAAESKRKQAKKVTPKAKKVTPKAKKAKKVDPKAKKVDPKPKAKKVSKSSKARSKFIAMATKPIKPSEALGTPTWFAKEILGMKLYPWQEKVLWDVALGKKPVALRAANGSGKTACVALPIILWHCATFPYSQVVTTAGVYRQVKEQLWGGIREMRGRLGNWAINQTDLLAPNGARAIGFSTDDPGKFEGWHNKNLLMIFDEAKSIPDEIFAAAERCQATRTLLMSSAGSMEGEFAAAFSSRSEFYSTHTVTAYDCKHLETAWIESMIAKWGSAHPLVRSMIFSQFTDGGASAMVCPRGEWEECQLLPPKFERGMRTAFIDWAAGGDENVVAIIDGNKVLEPVTWRDRDTMAAAGHAAKVLMEHNVPKERVYADDGGLGHPINDAMERGGFPIRRVLNNARSSNPEHFKNLGSELWYEASRMIGQKGVILPSDEPTRQQATSRKRAVTENGRLGLEKKESLKSRGLSSPDRADAVLAVIAIASKIGNEYLDSSLNYEPGMSDRDLQDAADDYPGCFAGL